MKIYGLSILQGMLVTLGHFLESYVEDFKRLTKKADSSIPGARTLYDDKGVCTVQYPEEELPIVAGYERFRVLPYLLYEQEQAADPKHIRCTACGICAKVCPPQCIWIVQESNEQGKPVPVPEAFYIDMSVCMNCGLCSEFCPFDAIKMSHEFTLTARGHREDGSRYDAYLYDMTDKTPANPTGLLVHVNEYAKSHPVAWKEEEDIRKAKQEKKAAPKAEKPAPAGKPEAKAAMTAEETPTAPPEAPPQKPAEQPAVSPPETPPGQPEEQPPGPPPETPPDKPAGPPPEVPAEPPSLRLSADVVPPEVAMVSEGGAVTPETDPAAETPALQISPDMIPREQDMVSEGGPVTEDSDPSALEAPQKPRKTSSKPKAASTKKKTDSKAKKPAKAEE